MLNSSYQTLVVNLILGGSKGYPSAKHKEEMDMLLIIQTFQRQLKNSKDFMFMIKKFSEIEMAEN